MLRHTLGNRLKAWNGALTQAQLVRLLFANSRPGGWWSWRGLAEADGAGIQFGPDISPNASNLIQNTGANQPICVKTGTLTRGRFSTSQWMQLGGSLSIGSVTKLTLIVAIRQASTSTGIIVESANLATSSGFGANISNGTAGAAGAGIRNSTNFRFFNVDGVTATPRNYVLTVQFDTGIANAMTMRVNGIDMPIVSVAASGTVSGNIVSSGTFSVGRRSGSGTLYLGGSDLFDLIVLPGEVAASLVSASESYLYSACEF